MSVKLLDGAHKSIHSLKAVELPDFIGDKKRFVREIETLVAEDFNNFKTLFESLDRIFAY